jgi:pyridoxamine 5'-phosphate oxidase
VIGEEAARLRREYESDGLVESNMADDPFTEFEDWFDGVITAGIDEPNAFVLATVDVDGAPSARAVLMKGISPDGLVFYTGMESRKSLAMRANPKAAATFVWTPLHRQVRFEGSVTEVDDETADAYFATRPRGAQIAAHASHQSTPVADRSVLEVRFADLDLSFGEVVPRPDHWGGWRLSPGVVEFWQGRPNRFHDRVKYLKEDGVWVKERLAP